MLNIHFVMLYNEYDSRVTYLTCSRTFRRLPPAYIARALLGSLEATECDGEGTRRLLPSYLISRNSHVYNLVR